MLQPDFFLKKYGIDSIVKELPEDEGFIRMIETFGVQKAYDGDEPYIFVSYCHKNSALVLPAIQAIQDKGYPVWYDAGINPGTEWLKVIADKIDKASLVIAFVSQESVVSRFCKSEISRAYNKEKPLLEVRLDRCGLPGEMEMQLDGSQRFNAFAYDDGDRYVELLANTPILSAYIKTKRMKEAEEAERKRREAEAAERKRREAEAAERKRREAEAAERKRREAEAAERKRREAERAEHWRRAMEEAEAAERKRREEAEAAERKRREAEAAKVAEQERIKREEEERKEAKRKAERKAKLEPLYKKVQASLAKKTWKGYSDAIKCYNEDMRHVRSDDGAWPKEEELREYKDSLRKTIYEDACTFAQTSDRRLLANQIFNALPYDYRDVALRTKKLNEIRDAEGALCEGLLVVAHVVLNIVVAMFVMPLVEPWYLKLLVMLMPVLIACGLIPFFEKRFQTLLFNRGIESARYSVVATCLLNLFIFQNMGIWERILWALIVSALNTVILFLAYKIKWALYKVLGYIY